MIRKVVFPGPELERHQAMAGKTVESTESPAGRVAEQHSMAGVKGGQGALGGTLSVEPVAPSPAGIARKEETVRAEPGAPREECGQSEMITFAACRKWFVCTCPVAQVPE